MTSNGVQSVVIVCVSVMAMFIIGVSVYLASTQSLWWLLLLSLLTVCHIKSKAS